MSKFNVSQNLKKQQFSDVNLAGWTTLEIEQLAYL